MQRDGAACRQSALAPIKQNVSGQLSFCDIRMELHATGCRSEYVTARAELIQSVYRCLRIAVNLHHMQCTFSHAVCLLPVRIKPFGTKEHSFGECRKKKKKRDVARSRPSRGVYFIYLFL